jgi:hypothetical protein
VGKISKPDIPEALYIELRSVVHDLATSATAAAARMKLRAECSAIIKDAEKTESIAKTLRAAASAAGKTVDEPRASLAPDAQSITDDSRERDAIETIYDACTWLRDSQTLRPKLKVSVQEENAIAMRIVELQDRIRDKTKEH